MKKTTQIHIGGRHFIMDEDAYDKLNDYLDALTRHFSKDTSGGKEIIEDIEHRIAELFENKLNTGKQSIILTDVNAVIETLGKVEDFVYIAAEGSEPETFQYDHRYHRRLFRDPDDYYLGGVAGGLGNYFNISSQWVRLFFILLAFFKGVGLFIYAILWIAVPRARNTAEKLQMKGKPVNLTTIKDTVNEEYEKAKDVSGNHPKNIFEDVMRVIGLIIVAFFKFLLGFIGVVLLVMGSVFLAFLIMGILGFTNVFSHFYLWEGFHIPHLSDYIASSGYYYAALIALIVIILIPIVALIHGGIKILFNIHSKHPVLRAFLLTSWILAVVLFISVLFVNIPESPIETRGTNTVELNTSTDPFYLTVRDNTENKRITQYRILGYHFNYSKWDESLFDKVHVRLEKSSDEKFHLVTERIVKNVNFPDSDHLLNRIDYNWEQTDTSLILDKYFYTDDDDFWLFPVTELHIKIPEGKKIILTSELCNLLSHAERSVYCADSSIAEKVAVMNDKGILVPVK